MNPKPQSGYQFLSVGDAAAELGVIRSRLSRWLDANPRFISLVRGGMRLVRAGDLEAIGKAMKGEA